MESRLDLATAPSIEPVTLTEAKNFLRIDTTDDDNLITALIESARIHCERHTNRAFITQTWDIYYNSPPASRLENWTPGVFQLPNNYYDRSSRSLELPLAPLQSVTSIKSIDDADTETVFASTQYLVRAYAGSTAKKGTITLRSSASWPTADRVVDGFVIRFVAGYGDAATDVPEGIKQAILQLTSHMYNNRSECGESITQSPQIVRSLLEPYRLDRMV